MPVVPAVGADARRRRATTGASTRPAGPSSAAASPAPASSYTVTATEPRPSADDAGAGRAAAARATTVQQRFTELPDAGPAGDRPRRRADVGDAAEPYERVRRIHAYLTDRANGFRYSLATEPGTSGDDLVDFLRLRRGYCEQYAGAMAVMVRAAGDPGPRGAGLHTGRPCSEDGSRLITSDDAHAWVEVYFDGLGWVPFDPTPISDDRAVGPALGAAGGRRRPTPSGGADPLPSAPTPAGPTARDGPRRRRRPTGDCRARATAGPRRAAAGRCRDRAAGRGRRRGARPACAGAAAPAAAGRRDRGRAVGRADRHGARRRACGCTRPGRPRQAARELAGVMRTGGESAGAGRRPTPSGGWPGPRRRRATAPARPAHEPVDPEPHGGAAAPRAGRCWRAVPRDGRLRARLWPASLVTGGRGAADRRLAARPAARPAAVPGAAHGTRRPGRTTAAVRSGRRLSEACCERATGRSGGGSAPRGGSSAAGGRRVPPRPERPAAAGPRPPAGVLPGLDGAGGGLVVEDAEDHAAEGDQEAEDAQRHRAGDGAADEDGQARRRPGRRRAAACDAPSDGGRRCGRTTRTWDRHRRGRARSAPADAARARRAARRPPGGRSQGRRRLPPTVTTEDTSPWQRAKGGRAATRQERCR